ncbi:MAG: MerR family transcriptional regulator [Rhizobiales bacterium]|nr:MerR family transcriptional regulator [Hyphomicrobiales bacterium]
MEKAPDAFRTISEVAVDLDVPQHVLRFWESRFREIKPMKRGGGRRYYRPEDVALLRGIRHLLYGEGYTIRGVQRIIREQGIKFVQAAGRPVPRPTQPEPEELTEEVDATPETAAAEAERSRGLFALLPALLGDRNEPPGPEFAPEDIRPESSASPSQRAVPPVPGSIGMPREDLRRLQTALHEMAECRRLLDVALRENA